MGAFAENFGPEVQLRQDDLPQVLRSPPPKSHQLPQEEVRSHLQHQAQEEAEVNIATLCQKKVPLRFFFLTTTIDFHLSRKQQNCHHAVFGVLLLAIKIS